MKDFIKERKTSLKIVIGVILIGVFVLIHIKPKINWTAVGAIAAWFSAIASVCAIVVAVQIPKRIADSQNKIALFDKRFDFFNTLTNCISFSHLIRNSSTSSKDVNMFFMSAFSDNAPKLSEIDYDYIILLVEKTCVTLKKGIYLFDIEMYDEIHALSKALVGLIYKRDDIEGEWFEYMKTAQAVEERIIKEVEKTLNLDF